MPLAAVDERNRFAQHLFAPLPERYDRLAEVLSHGPERPVAAGHGGPHHCARRARARRGLASSILDVAAGTAGVAIQLARAHRRAASSAWT